MAWALGVAFCPSLALAQTWTGGRTTPSLLEVVAVDATGETGWPYGAEDIEGDGLDVFRPTEQSLDIRTAYATADATDFWIRVYVSNPSSIGGSVTIYAFVDSDEDATTGGSAAAVEIDPALDADPTGGGYEYVVAMRGNGAVTGLYEWRPNGAFAEVMPLPAAAAGDAGQDDDPISIGVQQHGYAQASVPIGAVGVTSDCSVRLFVRSVNESASTTASDLDVASAAACRPIDVNADGIPDVVVPPDCATDDQCAAGGICVGGTCVLAPPCATDADCAPDESCSAQGLCVVTPQGVCDTTADCGDLVCASGTCVACTTGRAACASGRSCAPDGRCVDGTSAGAGGAPGGGGAGSGGAAFLVDPGEEVQGGACTCRAARKSGHAWGLAGLLAGLLAFVQRRRGRAG